MADLSANRALLKRVQMAVFSGIGDADVPAAMENLVSILREAGYVRDATPEKPQQTERAERKGRDRQERGGFDRGEGELPITFATPPRTRLLSTVARVSAQLGVSGEDAKLATLLEAASVETLEYLGYGVARAEIIDSFAGNGWPDRIVAWAPLLELVSVTHDGEAQDLSAFWIHHPEAGIVRADNDWSQSNRPLWSVRLWAGWLTPADDFTTENLAFVASGKSLTLSAGTWPLLLTGDRISISGSDEGANDKTLTVASRTDSVVTVEEDVSDEAEGEEITVSVSNLPADIEQAVIERVADLRSGSTTTAGGAVTRLEADGVVKVFSTSSQGVTRVSAFDRSIARRARVPM